MKVSINGYGRKAKEPHFEVKCTYCNEQAEKAYGRDVLGEDNSSTQKLASVRYYWCRKCDAYVSTHPGTWIPCGPLANRRTRVARREAHSFFDKLWRDGHMSRDRAYFWLSEQLGIKKVNCHIGMFNQSQCAKTIKAVEKFLEGKDN